MKKIILIAAIMLIGSIQCVNAQEESEYSLEGIGKTLSKLNLISRGLCLGDFNEGLAWVRVSKGVKDNLGVDNWYGYIDIKGNLVTPFIYVKAQNYSEGLACVGDAEWNFGFIDKQGKTIIPFTYEENTSSFSEGLALVDIDSQYAYINKNGEIVIPQFKAYRANSFNGGIAPIEETKRNTHFIDTKGNIIIQSQPHRCRGFKDGFYGMDNYVIDTKGNIVVPAKYRSVSAPSEGLCGIEIRKEDRTSGYSVSFLWGFYDINKKSEGILPIYDAVRSFSEGLAAVQLNEKWGYINKQGELVIPYKFNEAYDFHKGYAFIKTGVDYQIIDKKGNTVLKLPNYEYFGGYFSEGLAVIKQNGKWGYVDVYGNSSLSPLVIQGSTNISTQNNQISNIDSPQTTNSSFAGGEAAMRRYIASTLKYPAVAEENGEQGDVVVGFTVEVDGSLTNIHIEKSVSEWLDKEAKRIIAKMPNWQPAQSGGVNVKSNQTVEVKFRLR